MLIIKRYTGKGLNVELQIQVLETDYLVHWMTQYFDNDECIINGIHFDGQGRVKGYWLYHQHPGDFVKVKNAYSYRFVSVDDCVLYHIVDRPEQHRGIPGNAQVILDHLMYYRYDLAEAHRKQVATSFAAFVTTTEAGSIGTGQEAWQPDYSDDTKYGNYAGENVPSGMIKYLYPGEDIKLATPPPAEGFYEYAKAKLRKMAVAQGISYENVSGDYEGVTFSSAKMGQNAQDLSTEAIQELYHIPMVLHKIACWWLELDELKGNGEEDEFEVVWTAPGKKMIDPPKQTKAIMEQVKSGLLSPQEAIKQMGSDPEEVLMQFKEWYDKCKDAGIVFETDYTKEYEILLMQAQKKAETKPGKSGE